MPSRVTGDSSQHVLIIAPDQASFSRARTRIRHVSPSMGVDRFHRVTSSTTTRSLDAIFAPEEAASPAIIYAREWRRVSPSRLLGMQEAIRAWQRSHGVEDIFLFPSSNDSHWPELIEQGGSIDRSEDYFVQYALQWSQPEPTDINLAPDQTVTVHLVITANEREYRDYNRSRIASGDRTENYRIQTIQSLDGIVFAHNSWDLTLTGTWYTLDYSWLYGIFRGIRLRQSYLTNDQSQMISAPTEAEVSEIANLSNRRDLNTDVVYRAPDYRPFYQTRLNTEQTTNSSYVRTDSAYTEQASLAATTLPRRQCNSYARLTGPQWVRCRLPYGHPVLTREDWDASVDEVTRVARAGILHMSDPLEADTSSGSVLYRWAEGAPNSELRDDPPQPHHDVNFLTTRLAEVRNQLRRSNQRAEAAEAQVAQLSQTLNGIQVDRARTTVQRTAAAHAVARVANQTVMWHATPNPGGFILIDTTNDEDTVMVWNQNRREFVETSRFNIDIEDSEY